MGQQVGVCYMDAMGPWRAPRPPADLQERRDQRLVERVGAGDESALSDLLGGYGPAVLGLATRITGDRALAEEVVQEVFLAVWRTAASYDAGRGSVRTWLLTQAHHRAVDTVRHESALRRRSTAAPEPTISAPPADDIVDGHWLADRRLQVRCALDKLAPEQRQVLELAYFGGLTQAQVAERASIPLGTVKSRTLTAMRRLRQLLDRGEEES